MQYRKFLFFSKQFACRVGAPLVGARQRCAMAILAMLEHGQDARGTPLFAALPRCATPHSENQFGGEGKPVYTSSIDTRPPAMAAAR